MTRRSQAFVAALVSLFVVATCSVLLAHAGTVQPDPCNRGHVWTPAKPAAEMATALLNASGVSVRVMQLSQPEGPARPASLEQCDRRTAEVAAEPPAPRASPVA